MSNDGLGVLRAALATPDRYAIEPNVEGVRALLTGDETDPTGRY